MNYERALRFPVAEEGYLVKVLIGAVISLIPIVSFIAMGYLYKLADNIIRGNQVMPDWSNLGEKFINGIVVFVISFIYMLIPFIIVMATGGLGHLFTRGAPGIFAGGFVLSFIVAIIIGFFLPMALMNYVGTGNFGAAFDFQTIFKYVTSRFNTYLLNYIILIGLGIILGVISMIPIIGWIIGIVGAFYISCVACFLFGNLYQEVSGRSGFSTVV